MPSSRAGCGRTASGRKGRQKTADHPGARRRAGDVIRASADAKPSQVWPYHLADGGPPGTLLRFDFVEDGGPRKDCLPITFCNLSNGDRGWRSKGIPVPRPLYRLPELWAVPDAPILVTEGEKAADAAQRLFPNCAADHADARRQVAVEDGWSPVRTAW